MSGSPRMAAPAAAWSGPWPSPLARLGRAFSFPVMLAAALSLVVFLTCRSRFNDPDMWWHLKVGEIIWESRSIPRTDQLSFTTGGHAWIPHEWLAELSIYAAYRLGGPQGLLLWLCGLAALLVVSLYALCHLYSGNARVALAGGLLGWFFGTIGLAIRPLILGHLFLVVELLVLEWARSRSRRWLWALPPLFVVWVNCHGSYALGLALLGVFSGCSFVELRTAKIQCRRWDRKGRALLLVVLAASAAALFLNPVGARLVVYPLNLFTSQPDNLANVSEWAPLDVHQPRGVALLAIAGLIGAIVLTRPVGLRLEELILLGLGAGMAYRHTRMLFVFGILAAPVVCRLLAQAWRWNRAPDNRFANAFLTVVSVWLMAAGFPNAPHIEQQIRKNNPAGAVEFIRQGRLSGPMLNEYLWGGYLIWTLPEQRVFIDGRADIFAWTGVLAEYGRWYTLQEDPALLLDKYGIRYCLLRPSAPMAMVLPYLPGWRKAYADESSVIFTRESGSAPDAPGK